MKKRAWTVVVAIAALLLPACSGTPSTPTLDPNEIYTQAAETVQAQLQETQAALPTDTATSEPTATQELAATSTVAIPLVNATVLPGLQTSATTTPGGSVTAAPGATLGVPPLATSTTAAILAPTATKMPGQKAGDAAEWQYNVPADGTYFSAGEQFSLAVGLKNVGSTTWTTDYALVYLGGTQLSGTTTIFVSAPVAPGEKAEFNIPAWAPNESGKYTSYWKLVNSGDAYIYEIYFTFNVN
ncbi:MAG: hypothetical protein GYA17_00810 [Chloroflexi bacterium]|nr:NBR1-Ig-like domain-containing protein [Anaerolineaceae bacterium]NMB86864.1 hypothetical protein [Chloroflexota bacterium]